MGLLVGTLLVLSGCGQAALAGAGSSSTPTPTPTASASATNAPPAPLKIVALGDSVTAGNNCGCTLFPQLYAQDLTRVRGVPSTAVNLGVNGQDSAGLLAMLTDGSSSADRAVAAANVVVITIGANDFGSRHDDVTSGSCTGGCLRDTTEHMAAEVTRIVARVHALRSNRATAVLITGYWNVFEDGQVAQRLFPGVGLAATAELTQQVNQALRQVAARTKAAYVDLYDAFKGPDTDGDDTPLLADDGDHPNAQGHALIAKRLLAEGLPGLDRG